MPKYIVACYETLLGEKFHKLDIETCFDSKDEAIAWLLQYFGETIRSSIYEGKIHPISESISYFDENSENLAYEMYGNSEVIFTINVVYELENSPGKLYKYECMLVKKE